MNDPREKAKELAQVLKELCTPMFQQMQCGCKLMGTGPEDVVCYSHCKDHSLLGLLENLSKNKTK